VSLSERSLIRRFVAPARFQVPPPPSAFVPRPELVDRLERSVAPLTVVVGSPGTGKTAVVGSWVARRLGTTVWLSCDPTDVDPVRFWAALATAVQRTVPGAGDDAVRRLDDDGRESVDAVASLASDCSSTPGLAIVIDDFHHAGAAPATMAVFVRSLPPGVRLVLVSRQDPSFPLGRLRVQGLLTELRDRDLRFGLTEARQLLSRLGVDITDPDLERVCELTEGWAAGLELAALALADRADIRGFLQDFAETDQVIDLLVNEVLDLQPPAVSDFLLQTSVLEAFDGRLCDKVTGRDDGREVLRRLHEAHLFVVELDHRAGCYRYHHLFRAFLQGRLRASSPERYGAAHASASLAYASQGDVMSAVRHAMAAADVAGAFELVRELAAGGLDLQDRQAGIDVMRAWLRHHGTHDVPGAPRRIVECCLMLAGLGAPDDLDIWLRRVEGAGSRSREPSTAARVAFVRGLCLLHRGDPEAALKRVDEAVQVLGDDVAQDLWVSQWPIVVGHAEFWLDDPAAARHAVEAARMSGVPSTVVDAVRFPGLLAWAAVIEGELNEAEHQARLALDAAEALGLPPTNPGWILPRLSLAAVARDRSDLDEGEHQTALAGHGAEHTGHTPTKLMCHLERARLAWVRGAADEAMAALDRARQVLPAATEAVTDHIDRLEARIAIDAGNPRASTLVERLTRTPERTLLEARVLLAKRESQAAVTLLDDATDMMSHRRQRVAHGLLLSRALARSHRTRALEKLDRTLRLAQPVGLLRDVVDGGPELHSLLEALPTDTRLDLFVSRALDVAYLGRAAPWRTSAQQPVDALSGRELDVVGYLASRLSYPDMARELYISVNTLKSHIKAVYRKLGVSTRAEAVRAARRAGLL
jgi:LuxR family transcriptional regulator, maltose regulon positive regulatory protein